MATARAAVDAGITLLDVAPMYGRGEAEHVIGEAFGGRLPEPACGIGTKVMLGDPEGPAADRIDASLTRSLATMGLDRVDLLWLHSNLVPDGYVPPRSRRGRVQARRRRGRGSSRRSGPRSRRSWPTAASARGASPASRCPARSSAAIAADPPPAAVQCATNLLDSVGAIYVHDEPFRPRDVVAAASARGCGVLGIRAVQAGALTDAMDRDLPPDDLDRLDFDRAAPFRALAAAAGESPAALAHRYALSMPGVDSVVLGVKNRTELAECVAAAERGPLDADLVAAIDARRRLTPDRDPVRCAA